jgi:transcriptional regulator with XRE-family HTH domain
MRFVFQELIRSLRRQRGLSVEQLAGKLGVDKGELLAAERDPTCRPTPLLIYKLSQYFELPQTRLAVLAGAVTNVAPDVQEEASRFAAKSESFAKLTRDEQQTLDEFVRFLKSGS